DRQAYAVRGDPIGVRYAHAAGRAVPGEDDVVRWIDAAEVGYLAVIGGSYFGIELELFGDVGDPAPAKALPREHRHPPSAEQRPDRHFHGARVGRGDDPQPVIRRQL